MQPMSEDKDKKIEPVKASPKIRKLKNHHYSIAYMSVSGMKIKDIAKEVSFNAAYIGQLLESPQMKDLCQKIHWQMFGKDIKKRIDHILPKAIDVSEKIMLDETVKPSIRKDIANNFMDRSLGKPTQPIAVHTSSIRELLITIKEKSAKKAIDSGFDEAKNQAIDAQYSELKDVSGSSEDIGEVERWVKENLSGG